jgi:hypothetical protein
MAYQRYLVSVSTKKKVRAYSTTSGATTPAAGKASGGSRTRNPRITNAVLCQLKLRWHAALPATAGRHGFTIPSTAT